MTRRLALLPIAVVATLSLVLAACSSTPAAPALTDPKEIVTKAVTSLNGIKTVEFTGTFTGSFQAPQMGAIDLSSITMSGAADIANKNAKFSLDAPTFLGTKVDAILVGNTAYYKLAGAAAMAGGGTADKYTKADVPTASGNPAADATDVTKMVADLQAALDKLPTPPTKGADEKCGDQDCYHVTMKMTAADLKTLSPDASLDGDITIDLWTHKSDYRPAKVSLSMASTQFGTIGAAVELKYDTSVSISAPSADQIAP